MEKEITTEEILAELGYSVENLPANTGEVSSFVEALPQLRQHYDRLTPLGFRALQCFGYSENNTKTDDKEKYAQAKAPIFQGWNNSDYKGLTFTEFATWIRQGGWIGWTIPVGLVVIDVETKDVIDKIFKLVHYKKLKCWIHKTTNGYHIFFKAPGVDVSANSNGKTSLGNVTYRIGGKNMLILAPIMDRKWIDFKVGIEELSELPKELYPLVEGTTTTTSKAMYTTHKGVTDAWGGVEEGNRTLSLAKLVGSLKSDGISAENAISLLLAWNLRNNPPLPDDDVIKQVNDMYNRYPQSKITNAQRSTENQPVPSNQSVPARQISCLPYSPVIPVGFHVQIEVLDGREVLEESVLAVRVEKDGITHYFSLCTPFFIAEYINTRTGKKQLLKSMNGKEVVVDVTLSDVKTFEKEVVGTLIGNTMSRRTITMLIDYLEAYHHANKRYIETVDGIETTGWCGDTFYLPSRNQSGIRWMDKKLCKIFSIEGSREKQYPFMTFLLNKPAGLPLLMAFTAPLLDRFKIRNTTLHVTGYPHTGKTCSVHAAMSLYGNPELLYNTWNSTRVGKELFSSTFSDLPIWLDEWETAGVNINEIINQIYDFEGGKGKTRGTKSLRLQEEHHYRGILLSTGEKDLDSLIEGLKATRAVPRGAYRRVIEVVADEHYFKSFNEETAPPQDTIHDTIDKIYRFTSRNYGWVGSDWIEFIEKRENLEAIYGLLKENLQLFKNTGGMNTLFALMVSIVQSSFFGFLQEEDRNAITSYIVQLAEHQGKRVLITKNITEEFISKLSDYCMCNSKHFIGIANSDDVLEKYGLWGQVTLGEGGHVFILRSTFEEMCKKFGFVKNQVLKELAKEDKLITTESDGYFTRKQIYGFKYRGYLIKGVFSEVEDQVDAVIPITPKVMFPSEDSKEWKEVEINADSKRYR